MRLADRRGQEAVPDLVPPPPGAPGRGYSARAARRGRVRRWRRARRERARSWCCSSCARWPPAPRGQVRTGPWRAAVAPGCGGLHSGGPGWRGVRGGPLGGSVGNWMEGCPAGALRSLGGIPAPQVGSGPGPGAAGVGGGAAVRAPAAGHVRDGRGWGQGNGGALGLSGDGRVGLGSALPSGSPGARAEDAPTHRVPAHLFNRRGDRVRRLFQPRWVVFSLGKPRSLFSAAAPPVSAAEEQQRIPGL